MSMNLVTLLYLIASVCFIQALKGLSHPTTSIRGNIFGMAGMTIAVLTTAALIVKLAGSATGLVWVLLGLNLVIMVLFPGIAWQAHVGGFLAGAAATGAVGLDLIRRRSGRPSLAWPGIALVNLLIIAVIVLRYTVFA